MSSHKPTFQVTGELEIRIKISVYEELKAESEAEAISLVIESAKAKLALPGVIERKIESGAVTEWEDGPEALLDEDAYAEHLVERFLEHMRQGDPSQFVRFNNGDSSQYIDINLATTWNDWIDFEIEDGFEVELARDVGMPDELGDVEHVFWREYR